MNLLLLQNVRKLLSNSVIGGFLGRTKLHLVDQLVTYLMISVSRIWFSNNYCKFPYNYSINIYCTVHSDIYLFIFGDCTRCQQFTSQKESSMTSITDAATEPSGHSSIRCQTVQFSRRTLGMYVHGIKYFADAHLSHAMICSRCHMKLTVGLMASRLLSRVPFVY